tara:strand:+ start:622 stop:7524 length:6903 start_codon:yes stop_codon:yes gene_type:complete
MFELNGNAIGLEDIQKKAKEKGYNVDEYINFLKEKGLVEKTEGAVANDATVVPQTPDTDLASADTSSEQPKTKLWGGLVPIEVNEVNDKQFNRDGGFFEDLVVAARQGTKTGQSVEEAWDVYRQGKSISDEQLQGFIDATNALNEIGETNEQIEFRKAQEKEGGGFWGTAKALADNPGFFPQMLVSSYATMSTSLGSEEVAVATGAGAGVGSVVPVVGTMVGGLTGLVGAMETALTMTDLIKDELKGKDFNKNNVREILNDEKLFNKIRLRAVGRGVTIGAFEGVSMGLSRGVGSKILKTSKATPISKSLQISSATTGIETTGAFLGETSGQIVAGQDVDLGESLLEGIGETKGVVNTSDIVIKALNKPKYKINGELRSKEEIQEILDSEDLTVEELSKIKFDIDNDNAFAEQVNNKLNDAVQESKINEKVTDKADRKTLVDLNKQYNKAKSDTEKKGIFAVPGAKQVQENIEIQINDIIGRYEAVDGRTKEVKDIKKTAKVVQENIAEVEFQRNIEFAKKHSKLFNLNIKELSQEEINNQFKDKDAQESLGFIQGDQIIINKDLAKNSEVNGANVANHELLHGIIQANWKKVDKAKQKDIALNLLKSIGEKNKAVVDKRIEENYDSAYMEANPEEYLTIISDGIANGQIKFEDNIFTQVKDVIRNLMQSVGFANVNFGTSQGVYNFLKDYNKSIHKGSLASSVATAIKGEGAVEGLKTSKEASDKVQQIYQDEGVSGAMDIIDQFAPIVNRIVQKRSEAPNFDRQLLTDEINTGERGIFDLIQKYKPESGVPLAAYINKFLPARAIEASRRVLGEEFTDDVTEARGVAAEEAVEQQPERRTKLKVLADQLNVTDKVESEVVKADVDVDALTNFKSVPNAAINTVGELLGISPAKIKSKANLTAAEVANAQRWFNKNARLVIDALPQGFDAEGKATGVPKTVLEALYTKREARAKTKAGLRTQVKKPNIKESELLELIDVIDGKPTRNRNTSARIIALADLFGKTITNQEIRKQNPEILKIRDGMSTVMFSKEGKKSKESGDVDLNKIEGKQKQKDWLTKLGFATQPKSFWLNNGQIVGSGARYKNIVVDGKKTKEYELKDGERIAARKMLFANVDQLKDFIKEYEKNGGKFAPENDNVNAAIKRTTEYGKKTDKQVLDQVKKNKNLFDKSDKGFIDLWMAIQKDIQNNSNNKKHWAALLEVTSTTQANWMRVASRLIGGNTLGLTNVEEHMSPATDFAQYLWEMAKADLLSPSVIRKAMKSFTQISLPQVYDKLLKGEGFDYTKNLPGKDFGFEKSIKFEILSGIMPSWVRYINPNVNEQAHYINGIKYKGMNPNVLTLANGNNLAQEFGLGVDSKFEMNQDAISIQQELLFKVFVNNMTKAEAKAELDARMKGIKITKEAAFDRESKQAISDNISNVRPVLAYSKDTKGMSTFDFDETLIVDGENFVTATKDSEVVKIPSDKWPIDGPRYAEEGYTFDFSDFVNVRGGKEGPLLQKMKNQIKKYGSSNVFVLTARMQEAAEPIHKWLKSKGINIPLENITGLGKSEGDAKAQWFIDKYAEGYNDMYFVDDALPNVKAVKHVFDQLDVKGKSVQARVQFSKDLSPEFNKMIERKKGTGAEKVFSSVVGKKRGKNIGKYRFFVPPSADDFAGLLYDFYGKGKQGDRDMEFMKKALLDPFARADREMSMARMSILDDYKTLTKEMPNIKKKLGKIIDEDTGFTFDNAVRVYLFNKAGYDVPGISKRDLAYLNNVINTDQDLKSFADTLGLISKKSEGYINPGESWSAETIASDLENIVNKIGRKKYLAEFIENKNTIFSPENLNKIEAVYGSRFRSALEDSLYRMENGTNRSAGKSYGQSWTNWVNGSVGAIMFFNARSAVLQTLSTVNFINFQDNNIFAAGKAFVNQKQYWSDFSTLFNSDFLKARRAGLQINVNEAELANAVAGAQNKAKAALAYLLKKGFLPTQIADSFAIASGGSTFYRNRVKTYAKQGMDQKAAEDKAFLDFQEIAQETQQSSRPDRISQQQASPLGRLILAFANTPLQYNRLIKKAAKDLINKRGDWRSNMSRILYYGAIQNVIFSSLQQAIFALSFDDEDDEKVLDKKSKRVLNGTIDTLLRGSGVTGAAVATIKNVIIEAMEQSEKGFRADYGEVIVEALQVSPPMGSKARKVYGALKNYKFNSEVMGEMDTFDYNNPIWDAVGNVTSAATNVPLDRLIRKTDNIREAFNQENSAMQRTFLTLGWSAWDLQVGERVVINKGKDNEYIKYLPLKQKAQKEAEKQSEDKETRSDGRGRRGRSGRR